MSAWSCKHSTNTDDHSWEVREVLEDLVTVEQCFDSNNYHELNNNGVTGTVLQAHFIFIRTLWGKYYYSHFKNEKMETQRD